MFLRHPSVESTLLFQCSNPRFSSSEITKMLMLLTSVIITNTWVIFYSITRIPAIRKCVTRSHYYYKFVPISYPITPICFSTLSLYPFPFILVTLSLSLKLKPHPFSPIYLAITLFFSIYLYFFIHIPINLSLSFYPNPFIFIPFQLSGATPIPKSCKSKQT